MITLQLLWKAQPRRRSGVDGLRALLELFSDVIRDEVLMGQRLGTRESVQMIIELRAVVNGGRMG